MPIACIEQQKLYEKAISHGLKLLGHQEITPLGEPAFQRLQEWQRSGKAADLKYMLRDPTLLCDPRKLGFEEGSILSFAIYYSRKKLPPKPDAHGRIARYAWGKDYHKVFKRKLSLLAEDLKKDCLWTSEIRFFSDAVPLLERAFAERAGLGFVGKNTLLIRYHEGSYFFIAEMFIPAKVINSASDSSSLRVIGSSVARTCGSCTQCKQACPTQALEQDYSLDARKCISYLSIEKRGMLNTWERQALGDWLFGCDICQESCPYNYRALKEGAPASFDEFEAAQGCGPYLSIPKVLNINSEMEFQKTFAGTPLLRTKREGLLRNALCVAVNQSMTQLLPQIKNIFDHDSSAVLRATALWAAYKLQGGINKFSMRSTEDALVIAEYDQLS